MRQQKYEFIAHLSSPILTYACETWTTSKLNENKLDIFERRVLRRIFGGICENGIWRKRYNHELYQLYKNISASATVKIHRLRWAGHIIRADDAYPPKRILVGQPQQNRKRGRPRLRWVEGVDSDAAELGIRC